MSSLVLATLLFTAHAAPVSKTVNLDSLRHEAASLSAQGKLDSALALVESAASSLPASWAGLFRGKLELRGAVARKAFETAAKDSLHGAAPRGEALFRLGQFHYATGKYQLAIPQFREYLQRYPKGPWRDPASYWMAYACLQLAQQPTKKTYLDSGLRYLEHLESKSRPKGYYLPLALTAKARLLLARGRSGDTAAALASLEEARRDAPPEEVPATLLLSGQATAHSESENGHLWEDSVLWEFPSSLEASLLVAHIAAARKPRLSSPAGRSSSLLPPKDSVSSKPLLRYTLQLGNFSMEGNAQEMLKVLAKKGIRVWIEQNASGENRMFRVLHGIFPDTGSARQEGGRIFKPLSYPFQVIVLPP